MYARILFAWPDEPAYKPLTDEIAEIEPQIINALCRLIDLDDGEDGNFAGRSIPLDSTRCGPLSSSGSSGTPVWARSMAASGSGAPRAKATA